jgi:putative acetyltransferase
MGRAAEDVQIRVDDLRSAQIIRLLEEHLRNMHEITPAESVHALDLSGLRQPDITMWSAWEGVELLGCGALKALDGQHGEVKSMRTVRAQLRKGVASAILREILAESARRAYRRVSLETGSPAAFEPARALYARFGFRPCGPFADYTDDPNSYYMTLELGPRS